MGATKACGFGVGRYRCGRSKPADECPQT